MRTFWLPHQGKWISFTNEHLAKMSKDDVVLIEQQFAEYENNRIAHFIPHGEGRQFLNDWTNSICMLVAPNRVGKSAHGTAWTILRAIPCERHWPIFQYSGIDFHEWRGTRRMVISSYSWDNVDEVWKEYQRWLPRYELGHYAADWGRDESEKGKGKTLSFGDGKPKRVMLQCGTELIFLCDNQSQAHWEGKRWDDGHFEEQREEEKFVGYLRGTDNTPGLVQCCFSLTGHILPDRPDTGAGGWIKKKLWDGNDTMGRTVGRYKIAIPDVPECVLSSEKKAQLKRQWVDIPEATKDIRKMRQAEARYWGGWERGGGNVLDNFSRLHHLIPRIEIPASWTLYRGLDHGREQPMACLCMAVAPWGDRVFYREYYQPGRTIPYHCEQINRMCGSTRSELSQEDDAGQPWKIYMEVFGREHFFASVMDSRSFSRKLDDRPCTIGQFYNDCGLQCTPASASNTMDMTPRMNAALEIDRTRPHIMKKLHEAKIISDATFKQWLSVVGGDYMCGARQYFFGDLKMTIQEIEGWQNDPKTGKPMDKDDHAMSAWKFLESTEPRHMGDYIQEYSQTEQSEPSGYKYVGA